MIINSGGSVINLRDRLQEADRKKTQSDSSSASKSATGGSSSSVKSADGAGKSTAIADIIGVRNENMLAIASSEAILTPDDAMDALDELKKQFSDDTGNAINAHKQTDANTVMQFYPFE